jgi:hypothetical protein
LTVAPLPICNGDWLAVIFTVSSVSVTVALGATTIRLLLVEPVTCVETATFAPLFNVSAAPSQMHDAGGVVVANAVSISKDGACALAETAKNMTADNAENPNCGLNFLFIPNLLIQYNIGLCRHSLEN